MQRQATAPILAGRVLHRALLLTCRLCFSMTRATVMLKHNLRLPRALLVSLTGLLVLAAAPGLRAAEGTLEIGSAVPSRVPGWNARGLGPLPWQGVACVDVSQDGRFTAVGTIAPPGDPEFVPAR